MKIALIIPPIDKVNECYGKDVDWGWWQPLGLLAIASYIKVHMKQAEIIILDEQTASLEEIFEKVNHFKPDWLGISPDYLTYRNSLALAKSGKALGSRVVFGGHYATNLGKIILKNRQEVDFVVCEDGEKAMLGLLLGKPMNKIPNLVWRRADKRIVKNRILYNDLDKLPFIDYSLVNLKKYFENYLNNQKIRGIIQPFKRPMTFSSQRGCGWREKIKKGCLFCSCIYPLWRARTPENVWEEVMINKEKYDIDAMVFGEDDFLSHPGWFEEFYRKKPNNNRPGIRFIYVRPGEVNEKVARQLSELNCFQVFVGMESGNNQCLKKLCKGVTVKQLIKAAELLTKYNIQFNASFALGAPGETKDTLEETYVLAQKFKELNANGFNAYPLLPIPGSSAWRMGMQKSPEFRKMFQDKDMLDPEEIIHIWIKKFCNTGVDEVFETSMRINKLFYTDWNF